MCLHEKPIKQLLSDFYFCDKKYRVYSDLKNQDIALNIVNGQVIFIVIPNFFFNLLVSALIFKFTK
jgi:hypothetical protein